MWSRDTIASWVSKPIVVVTISVLALIVSSATFFVATKTYFRQGDRWQTEDRSNGPQATIVLDPTSRQDGWRRAVIQVTNQRKVGIDVIRIEAVRPSHLQLAQERVAQSDTSDRGPTLPAASALSINRAVDAYFSPTGNHIFGAAFYFKADRTDASDVILRVVMRESDYPHRDWTREVSFR